MCAVKPTSRMEKKWAHADQRLLRFSLQANFKDMFLPSAQSPEGLWKPESDHRKRDVPSYLFIWPGVHIGENNYSTGNSLKRKKKKNEQLFHLTRKLKFKLRPSNMTELYWRSQLHEFCSFFLTFAFKLKSLLVWLNFFQHVSVC